MTTPKILLKRSTSAGAAPTASDLSAGEIAINLEDGRLYYKDASDNIKNFIDSDIIKLAIQNISTDSGDVAGVITATVNKAFVDALNINASLLNGGDSSFFLNYNNFTNTPSILDQL